MPSAIQAVHVRGFELERPISAFSQDEESHWFARLSCGHTQHTRHIPPLSERPWVLTEEGRASRLGTHLDCLLCDRGEMPDGHVAYRRTPSFAEDSVPAALTSSHATKAGVWGLIHVERGELEYVIEDVQLPHWYRKIQRIGPRRPGVVLPEVEHRVRPVGAVSFYVEFWRDPPSTEVAAPEATAVTPPE